MAQSLELRRCEERWTEKHSLSIDFYRYLTRLVSIHGQPHRLSLFPKLAHNFVELRMVSSDFALHISEKLHVVYLRPTPSTDGAPSANVCYLGCT